MGTVILIHLYLILNIVTPPSNEYNTTTIPNDSIVKPKYINISNNTYVKYKKLRDVFFENRKDSALRYRLSMLKYGHKIIPYMWIIDSASNVYNVDRELIISKILVESRGFLKVKSSVGASGLLQLMPKTAKGLGVTDVNDPFQNIMAGTKYFKFHVNNYNSIELALAAYNAGPGNVRKYNGVPPFRETKSHIYKVLKFYKYLYYDPVLDDKIFVNCYQMPTYFNVKNTFNTNKIYNIYERL